MNALSLSMPRLLFSIVLFFGVVLTFVIPPFQTPDEDSHLTRALMVSEGHFGLNMVGCPQVPSSLVEYLNQHTYLKFHPEQKYAYPHWYSYSYISTNSNTTVTHCYSAQSFSPLMYVPPAAGILAARVVYALSPLKNLGFNWSAMTYSARLGNVLALAIAVAFACAWASRFSSIVFAVATLPMTMQAASSPSYDTTTIIVCLLFFALVVRTVSAARVPERREVIGLLVLAFLVAHSKIVYAPVILVAVALKRWMSWRAFIKLGGGLVGASVVGVLLTLALGLPSSAKDESLQHQQVQFLLSHPVEILHLVPDTLHANRDFYTVSFLADFGWLDTMMPLPALMLIWASLLLAVVIDALRGPNPLFWIGSVGAILATVSGIVATIFVLYIIWTPHTRGVGAAVADGVQGRYFIPFAPFVMAAVAVLPESLAARTARLRDYLVQAHVTTALAMLAVMVFTVVLRFWIPELPR